METKFQQPSDVRGLLQQRVFQITSGYEDGNDANALREESLFKLATGCAPLDTDNALASGATHPVWKARCGAVISTG